MAYEGRSFEELEAAYQNAIDEETRRQERRGKNPNAFAIARNVAAKFPGLREAMVKAANAE